MFALAAGRIQLRRRGAFVGVWRRRSLSLRASAVKFTPLAPPPTSPPKPKRDADQKWKRISPQRRGPARLCNGEEQRAQRDGETWAGSNGDVSQRWKWSAWKSLMLPFFSFYFFGIGDCQDCPLHEAWPDLHQLRGPPAHPLRSRYCPLHLPCSLSAIPARHSNAVMMQIQKTGQCRVMAPPLAPPGRGCMESAPPSQWQTMASVAAARIASLAWLRCLLAASGRPPRAHLGQSMIVVEKWVNGLPRPLKQPRLDLIALIKYVIPEAEIIFDEL